jgi:hypothetical protein
VLPGEFAPKSDFALQIRNGLSGPVGHEGILTLGNRVLIVQGFRVAEHPPPIIAP